MDFPPAALWDGKTPYRSQLLHLPLGMDYLSISIPHFEEDGAWCNLLKDRNSKRDILSNRIDKYDQITVGIYRTDTTISDERLYSPRSVDDIQSEYALYPVSVADTSNSTTEKGPQRVTWGIIITSLSRKSRDMIQSFGERTGRYS